MTTSCDTSHIDNTTTTTTNQSCHHHRPKKLKPLVITMGSKRQANIQELFAHPTMQANFHPPTFSPGVPQRALRSRLNLLHYAGKAGIIPPHEWQPLSKVIDSIIQQQEQEQEEMHNITNNTTTTSSSPSPNNNNNIKTTNQQLDECLSSIPIQPGRKGSSYDIQQHYSKELWQKSKSINRGRSVLACTFAHLIAMKKLVSSQEEEEEEEGDGGGYDFILEDNVRAPIIVGGGGDGKEDDYEGGIAECAERIRHTIDASHEWQLENVTKCHLRYYGWLGSIPNLEFVIHQHSSHSKYIRKNGKTDLGSVFPFPITSDFELYPQHQQQQNDEDNDDDTPQKGHKKAGGTPIWGAYAYWVSKEGYDALIKSLQNDVGALLWKGKRMRYYTVKPIDKILPRRIIEMFSSTTSKSSDNDENEVTTTTTRSGRDHIHVTTVPAFVRAPMLTSQIHSQWDPEFCKSTEYQMKHCVRGKSYHENNGSRCDSLLTTQSSLTWDDIWLPEGERRIVNYKKEKNVWITMAQLESLSLSNSS